MPAITIVVPTFNEATNVEFFFDEVCRVIRDLNDYTWELIFIDDGSVDETWKIIKNISSQDQRVKGISLSRNFGKEIALTAGVESVSDVDAVIFMDADLQHPPELIPELIRQWKLGFQVVVTRRTAIQYSWVRGMGSRLFYFLLNRFTSLDTVSQSSDFRLLDRKVFEMLRGFTERNRFFRGLVDWMGFKKTCVTFAAANRVRGKSTFSFNDLSRFAVNALTSFSLFPLRITGYVGVAVLFFSLFTLIYMLVAHHIFEITVITPLAYFIVFNTLLFGVVLAALGMIALYIGHIHTEVIGRPIYIVQERAGFDNK